MIDTCEVTGNLVHRQTGVIFKDRDDLMDILANPDLDERARSRAHWALCELEEKLALESMSKDANIWLE